MENNKINIAEILRECPPGMELDCTMYDNVRLKYVSVFTDEDYPICIETKSGFDTKLTKYGQNVKLDDAKCVIFPKGKTTWEGFVPYQFKVGDRIIHKDSGIYCTFGEYSEGISAYRTSIGLMIKYKDLEQWELLPNKFDIGTLKPFDKVLVRHNTNEKWDIDLFSCIDNGKMFRTITGTYVQCIPYEGNEHLLDTDKDCNDYYKTWEG